MCRVPPAQIPIPAVCSLLESPLSQQLLPPGRFSLHLPWDVLDVFDALEPVILLSKMHQSFLKTHPSATGEPENARSDGRLSLTSIPVLQVLHRIPI